MSETPKAKGIAPGVRKPIGLAVTGFAGLVLLAVLIALLRGDSDDSTPVVLKVILVAVGVIAYGLMIAGGFMATVELRAGSMESGSGRFLVRCALVLALALPAMALLFRLLSVTDIWEGDSGPFLLVWITLALITSVAGAFTPEPGRRGLVVFPFLVGVAALVLLLSELTGLT